MDPVTIRGDMKPSRHLTSAPLIKSKRAGASCLRVSDLWQDPAPLCNTLHRRTVSGNGKEPIQMFAVEPRHHHKKVIDR